MSCNLYAELLPELEEIINKPDTACPVAWALNAADTARMNNCGKSVMCRDGMQQLYSIILDITTEKGRSGDIELISDICAVIKDSQGCEIAAKAAALIHESAERHSGEWELHIRRKRCSALVCEGYSAAPGPPAGAGGATQRRKRKAT